MEAGSDTEQEAALRPVASAGLAVANVNSEVGSLVAFVASAAGGSAFPVAQNFQALAQID